MKNLGGRSCGGTQHVLYLVTRQAEFVSDSIDRLAGQEQPDNVVDGRSPTSHSRPTKGMVRVHGHLGQAVLGETVLGETDQPCVPVAGEVDPAPWV